MNWRIYRLPGSRDVWHIDAGQGTPIFNVKSYQCGTPSKSVDIGGNNVPRAWIEIHRKFDFHIINDVAIFSVSKITVCKCKEQAKCVAAQD